MGQVLGGMACCCGPAPFVPLCCLLQPALLCKYPSPHLPSSENPSAPRVMGPWSPPSLCGPVSWALGLLQFPVLFRNEGTIEFLGQSDDL